MNSLMSLNISIGIIIVLVGIVVYCIYKIIDSVPKLYQLLNDYKKSQQEMQNYLNNLKSWDEILQKGTENIPVNFKCPNPTGKEGKICNIGYACDGCPYNEEIT